MRRPSQMPGNVFDNPTVKFLRAIFTLLLFGIFITGGAAHSDKADKAPRYRIIDLGHLPGGFASYAKAINKFGQITGFDYFTFQNFQNNTVSAPRAFLYEDGQMTDLGALGGIGSAGAAINAQAHVVGNATIPSGDMNPPRHAFFYDGTMHDLGTLGGRSSSALGVNKHDQVVGIADLNNFVSHAFLYDGTMHDLGAPDGVTQSQANAINDKGQIVGVSWDRNTVPTNFRAFIYDGAFHDLGTLGGPTAFATAINKKGLIVGYSQISSGATHPFLYDGVMHDLAPGKDGSGSALAINDADQVVGQWVTRVANHDQLTAFLFEKGTLYDLKQLLDSSGDAWNGLSEAAGINSRGQIVGAGEMQGTHAFLLSPRSRPHDKDEDDKEGADRQDDN